MICSKCDFQNEETAKFCRNCGTKLYNQQIQQPVTSKICTNCGFQNADNVMFCGKCGMKLYPNEKHTHKVQSRLWGILSIIFVIVLFFSVFIVIDASKTSKNIEEDLVETGFAPKYIRVILKEGPNDSASTGMEIAFYPSDTAIYAINNIGFFGKVFHWSAQTKLIVGLGGFPGSYIASKEEIDSARKEVIILTQEKIHKTREMAIWMASLTGFMLIMALILRKRKILNR